MASDPQRDSEVARHTGTAPAGPETAPTRSGAPGHRENQGWMFKLCLVQRADVRVCEPMLVPENLRCCPTNNGSDRGNFYPGRWCFLVEAGPDHRSTGRKRQTPSLHLRETR